MYFERNITVRTPLAFLGYDDVLRQVSFALKGQQIKYTFHEVTPDVYRSILVGENAVMSIRQLLTGKFMMTTQPWDPLERQDGAPTKKKKAETSDED